MSRMSSYLLHTPKGFFFRMRVPKHLQMYVKKREFKKAITTTDRGIAERQAILYAAKVIELLVNLEGHVSDYSFQMIVNLGGAKIEIAPRCTQERRN